MSRKDRHPTGRYALGFADGTITAQLDASDRATAFETAQRLVKDGRPATLYEDGEPLARISYSPAGFWTVSEQGSRVA